MEKLISYKGNAFHYENRDGNIMVNVTEFVKAFPDKKSNLSHYIESNEIQEYVKILADMQNLRSVDLLEVKKGGVPGATGTWAKRKVALRIAQRISTEFAVWVDLQLEKLLETGHVELSQTALNSVKGTDVLLNSILEMGNADERKKMFEVYRKIEQDEHDKVRCYDELYQEMLDYKVDAIKWRQLNVKKKKSYNRTDADIAVLSLNVNAINAYKHE